MNRDAFPYMPRLAFPYPWARWTANSCPAGIVISLAKVIKTRPPASKAMLASTGRPARVAETFAGLLPAGASIAKVFQGELAPLQLHAPSARRRRPLGRKFPSLRPK